MHLADRIIAWFSPRSAIQRVQARRLLAYYEAGRRDTLRKQRRETANGDTAVYRAGTSPREQARHLDQNHDIARNALNILVQNIVGPNGVGVEPQPRTHAGEIHDDFARAILRLYREWGERPEVTWSHDVGSMQRLLARTWLRDGEGLAQHLLGARADLDHGTVVPYSVELIEPDYLPYGLNSDAPWVTMGVERNGWGRPVGYHLYKSHPGDLMTMPRLGHDTRRISADRISHLKVSDRIGQARGVSVFAAVLSRLDDLKDYEESERIAAKVAASMAAFIRKGAPDVYGVDTDEAGEPVARDLKFVPGMIFDDLEPGEEIGTIDTSRPNTNLEQHRNGQLRAAAGGFQVAYSSLSKNYNGTYSAQRQELVEQFGAYGVLAAEFIGQFVRPCYQRFLQAAIASRQLVVPAEVDRLTLTDAFYMPPQMPWVDPNKEATAWQTLDEAGFASGIEIIRRRGLNPLDVLDQRQRWEREKQKRGQGATTPTPEARRVRRIQ